MYKIYAEVLENLALEQFMSAMDLSFVVKGALMPDAHAGYGLPIGAVVATKDVVVPSWVGYDIGCGMSAIRLDIKRDIIAHFAQDIYNAICKAVPVGFKVHNSPRDCDLESVSSVSAEFLNARAFCQLGTLGSGNHFLEIGYDEEDYGWIVVHSGSRGYGHAIASHYMKLGDYLEVDSSDGKSYIADLDLALRYALLNRELMIYETIKAIDSVVKVNAYSESFINRNHNHAEYKDGLWIHRKGATHAEDGMMGVIPGNMRDGSFIVRGKGNPDSLCSSSHGAGRVLGRNAAKKSLSLSEFSETMKGVVANVQESTLDESPFAYKNIFDVMRLQADLVDTVSLIRPLVNIKG